MDGRIQIPTIDWIKKNHSVDYVDMITEPGPNKTLAENVDTFLVESIKKRLNISLNKHSSKLITISGHYDCAGNPVDKEIQLSHILEAVKLVRSWNYMVPVIGLWIDETWSVYKI
jgi:hypothetical protein